MAYGALLIQDLPTVLQALQAEEAVAVAAEDMQLEASQEYLPAQHST